MLLSCHFTRQGLIACYVLKSGKKNFKPVDDEMIPIMAER